MYMYHILHVKNILIIVLYFISFHFTLLLRKKHMYPYAKEKANYMGCQIKLTPISQLFDFKMDFMACLRDTGKERRGD